MRTELNKCIFRIFSVDVQCLFNLSTGEMNPLQRMHCIFVLKQGTDGNLISPPEMKTAGWATEGAAVLTERPLLKALSLPAESLCKLQSTNSNLIGPKVLVRFPGEESGVTWQEAPCHTEQCSEQSSAADSTKIQFIVRFCGRIEGEDERYHVVMCFCPRESKTHLLPAHVMRNSWSIPERNSVAEEQESLIISD